MELSIGAHDVLLSLHPSYCTGDDGAILQAAARYAPLVDWLTKFRPDGFTLSRITIRNVQWIAQRIAALTIDVELAAKGEKTTQTVTLSDEKPVALLPVLTISGHAYGVLAKQHRVALGGAAVEEALIGTVGKEGFASPASAALAALGFKLDSASLVAIKEGLVTLDPSVPPCSLVKTSHVLTRDDAAALFEGTAAFEGGVLVCRPLADIARSARDLKALTMATLCCRA